MSVGRGDGDCLTGERSCGDRPLATGPFGGGWPVIGETAVSERGPVRVGDQRFALRACAGVDARRRVERGRRAGIGVGLGNGPRSMKATTASAWKEAVSGGGRPGSGP